MRALLAFAIWLVVVFFASAQEMGSALLMAAILTMLWRISDQIEKLERGGDGHGEA